MTQPLPFYDAWTCIGRSLDTHPRQPFSIDDLLQQMRACHVGQALVSRRDQTAIDLYQANLSLSRLLPECLAPLWTVVPGDAGDFPQGDSLLNALTANRVPAVQILPHTHAWNPCGKSARKLFQALAEGGWPIFVSLDPEFPVGEFEASVSQIPDVNWVALHGSWKRQREIAALVLHNPQVYLTLECYHANRGIEFLIEKGAGDRLLFASGAPGTSLGAAKASVDWLQAEPGIRAAIAGETLRRILRFPPAGHLSGFLPHDEIAADAADGRPLHCEVIDVHSHIIEDGHQSGGAQVMLRGDATGLLDMADRVGIDQIGVMTWRGIQGPEQDAGHVPVIAAVEKHPDRFWALATIHIQNKSDAERIADLEKVRQNRRILGLKPYPSLGLPYDAPAYSALWAYAEKQGIYIGVHPFHWYEPDEFISICTRHPDLVVIAYHAAHSFAAADTVIELCQRFPNLYAETNYSSVAAGAIEYLVQGCGADRVLFGTDQPMRDPRPQLGWVVYADLPLAAKKAVLGGNARRLLKRITAKQDAAQAESPAPDKADLAGIDY